MPQWRRASVSGSAAGVALRLRSAICSSPPSAPLFPLANHRPKPISVPHASAMTLASKPDSLTASLRTAAGSAARVRESCIRKATKQSRFRPARPLRQSLVAGSTEQPQPMKPNREPRRRDQRSFRSAMAPLLPSLFAFLRSRSSRLTGAHLRGASVGSLASALRYFLRPCPPLFGNAPLPSPTSQPKRGNQLPF